jgi:hypothetical protein
VTRYVLDAARLDAEVTLDREGCQRGRPIASTRGSEAQHVVTVSLVGEGDGLHGTESLQDVIQRQ